MNFFRLYPKAISLWESPSLHCSSKSSSIPNLDLIFVHLLIVFLNNTGVKRAWYCTSLIRTTISRLESSLNLCDWIFISQRYFTFSFSDTYYAYNTYLRVLGLNGVANRWWWWWWLLHFSSALRVDDYCFRILSNCTFSCQELFLDTSG